MYLEQLEVGSSVKDFFILQDFSVRTSKTGKEFFSMKLRRNQEIINAFDWDKVSQLTAEHIGSVVWLFGTVTMFNEIKQFTVINAVPATDNTQYNLRDLLPVAPIDVDECLSEIYTAIWNMKDEQYKSITESIINKIECDFKILPAGKTVHHSFISGLLMHTTNMLKIAQSVLSIYSGYMDKDLVVAGIILHDIGKLIEYTTSDFGLITGVSVKGELEGHLVSGAFMIDREATSLCIDSNHRDMLVHILLSHHGIPDYGAAVTPKTIEAELVHQIDGLDSKIQIYCEALDKIGTSGVSEKIFSLGHCVVKHE